MMDRSQPAPEESYRGRESELDKENNSKVTGEFIQFGADLIFFFAEVARVNSAGKTFFYFNGKHSRLATSRGERCVICLLAFALCRSEDGLLLEALPLGCHDEFLSPRSSLYNTGAHASEAQLAIRSSI